MFYVITAEYKKILFNNLDVLDKSVTFAQQYASKS